MNKKKIFNDPVYGFITIPFDLIFDLIEHPYFQRLRRIRQLGLTDYVYPGALHTRFHHALGAMHLMTKAVQTLRFKGVDISDEESKAVIIAILLHDIGHGPISHTLEHTLLEVHHETLSIYFMEALNEEFDGALSLAIKIFKNKYDKKFLHQLVSSQLDMDRMDYLNRDSFFTGVSEGVIGYDRIIEMLAVSRGRLVVEEKGLYSVENFLLARRLMYWQVYLHKTVLCAEQMLIRLIKRAKAITNKGIELPICDNLNFFLYKTYTKEMSENYQTRKEILTNFANIDDYDIMASMKILQTHNDFILAFLAKSLINRQLFKVELKNSAFSRDYLENIRLKVSKKYKITDKDLNYLVFSGYEYNSAYTLQKDEIEILLKKGVVLPISKCSNHGIIPIEMKKYYLCYPKDI